MESYTSIKHLAEDDRPREKLMLKGRHALSDAELIAILIGSGSRNESAVQLSQRILRDHNNDLNVLAKLSIQELCSFKGIGEAKAITIAAALELGRRKKDSGNNERVVIKSSYNAYEAVKVHLSDLPHEEFWVVMLNRANAVVRMECVSKGGINATLVDARLVFKPALLHGASSIVLAHNHPSGNLKASDEDVRLTKKLREAGKLFDISIIDHIIVGENKYYSFADEGMMGN